MNPRADDAFNLLQDEPVANVDFLNQQFRVHQTVVLTKRTTKFMVTPQTRNAQERPATFLVVVILPMLVLLEIKILSRDEDAISRIYKKIVTSILIIYSEIC